MQKSDEIENKSKASVLPKPKEFEITYEASALPKSDEDKNIDQR